MKFIQLTEQGGGNILINPDKIVYIQTQRYYKGKEVTRIDFGSVSYVLVKESLEEIVEAVETVAES